MHKLRTIFFITLCTLTVLKGSCQLKDTTSIKWYKSKVFKTVALPAVLIGYGISVINDHGLFYTSFDGRRDILKAFPGFHTRADDITEHTPTSLVYGLNLLGVKSKNNFSSRIIICFIAYSIKSTIVAQLKNNSHILRPDSSDNLSFPSGHTANAFVGAEFMHQEYINNPWIYSGGYLIATATGALRMMNNKHWLSDVAAGAGVGILSTRLAYLIFPWVRKELCIGNSNALILPTYNNKTLGMAFSWSPANEAKR